MLGKLREKLKSTLSLFSKKTQEEAQPVPAAPPAQEKKPSAQDLLDEVAVEKTAQQPPVSVPPTPPKKEVPPPAAEKPLPPPTHSAPVHEKKPEQKPTPPPTPIVAHKPETKPSQSPVHPTPSVTQKPIHQEEPPRPAPLPVEKPVQAKSAPEKTPTVHSPPQPIPPSQPTTAPAEEKKGFFARAKEFLTTKQISAEKFDELFWDLELILLENNVSLEVIEKIKDDLKTELVDKPLPRDVETVISETLRRSIEDVLSLDPLDITTLAKQKKPLVIALFGVNGSGKTTTAAKLAHYLTQHKLTCVLAAADTFRAAAIQQLEEHANKLGIKLIKHDYGADAAAVAFDAVKYAQKNGTDVVLIDTAGRLHSNTNLMDELKKVVRVAKPDLKLFVGESITGNDCVTQATKFAEAVELDGIILTKADVDEKGGAALSISYVTQKPILFIGLGQGYDDLKLFSKEIVLENLGLT